MFALTASSNFRDPQNRDENIDYYIAKRDELLKKFGIVVPAAEQETLQLWRLRFALIVAQRVLFRARTERSSGGAHGAALLN